MGDSDKELKISSDVKNHHSSLDASQSKATESKDDDLNFKFRICKSFEISVFKPLLDLKFLQLFWFGAAYAMEPFITLYFKQLGLTVSEQSAICLASTPIQFLTGTMSGAIADKIGSLKPVLVTNIIIYTISLFCMLLIPNMKDTYCSFKPVQLRYNHLESDELTAKASCGINRSSVLQLESCYIKCPQYASLNCLEGNLTCEILTKQEELSNFTLSLHIKRSYISKSQCEYNVDCIANNKSLYSQCDVTRNTNCTITCNLFAGEKCSIENGYRTLLLVVSLLLMILNFTSSSNGFRLVSVALMVVVKEHDKSFGREMIWRTIGITAFSVLIGFVVKAMTNEWQHNNYVTSFYFYGSLVGVQMIFLYKMKIRKVPPSKRMWKKAAFLMKNPDIIVTLCVLLIISAVRGFNRQFLSWYLEDLKAPVMLIGLVAGISGLYGIPFLITAKWWVSKIGHTNIFLLTCIGLAAYCLGYSVLQDPWIALALEFITVLTLYIMFVALTEYGHSIAPEGLVSTVIAFFDAFYYCMGKGTGIMIGGHIMAAYGGRVAYGVCAVASLVCGVVYFIYLHIRRLYRHGNQHISGTSVQSKDYEMLE